MADRDAGNESTEQRLGRLARATEGLSPRADLAERLAAPYRAGHRPRRRIEALVLPWGRGAVAAAALAAAAAAILAFTVERGADEALLRLDDAAGWEP